MPCGMMRGGESHDLGFLDAGTVPLLPYNGTKYPLT